MCKLITKHSHGDERNSKSHEIHNTILTKSSIVYSSDLLHICEDKQKKIGTMSLSRIIARGRRVGALNVSSTRALCYSGTFEFYVSTFSFLIVFVSLFILRFATKLTSTRAQKQRTRRNPGRSISCKRIWVSNRSSCITRRIFCF